MLKDKFSGKTVQIYDYELSCDPNYWQYLFRRALQPVEKTILCDAKHEDMMNTEIKNAECGFIKNGLYIPIMPDMDGDCLFKSLEYHGIVTDVPLFRKGLSMLMITFKDTPYFFPNNSSTLREIFDVGALAEENNEKKQNYIYMKKTGKLYNYNYDAMCIDLSNTGSWRHLHSHLILEIISLFTGFIIHTHTEKGNKLVVTGGVHDPKEQEKMQIINLFLYNDIHYTPLDNLSNWKTKRKSILMTGAYQRFIDWADKMCIRHKLYRLV